MDIYFQENYFLRLSKLKSLNLVRLLPTWIP